MEYEYKVVPFMGQVQSYSAQQAQTVAEQLQKLISQGATGGWEFYRIDTVQIESKPGCLAGLAGARTSYYHFD